MPQDIKAGSFYNTKVPSLTDTADIIVALTNYHYGITTGTAPVDGSVTNQQGVAGWLKYLNTNKADLEGPSFTGVPLAPTANSGTNSTQIATTEFVQTAVSTKANSANTQLTGITYFTQPSPVAIAGSTATLTWANLKTLILTGSVTSTWTLPAASSTEITVNDLSFDWSVINTASSGATITIASGTNHTTVGRLAVAANTSARFRTRRVSSTSYITYRIS